MFRFRTPETGGAHSALHDELVALREENARLREAQFRPLAPTGIPAHLASVIAMVDGDAADDLSAAWLELEIVREGLLQAMADFQTLAGLVEAQLRDLVPTAEIDRRVRTERRRSPVERKVVSA